MANKIFMVMGWFLAGVFGTSFMVSEFGSNVFPVRQGSKFEVDGREIAPESMITLSDGSPAVVALVEKAAEALRSKNAQLPGTEETRKVQDDINAVLSSLEGELTSASEHLLEAIQRRLPYSGIPVSIEAEIHEFKAALREAIVELQKLEANRWHAKVDDLFADCEQVGTQTPLDLAKLERILRKVEDLEIDRRSIRMGVSDISMLKLKSARETVKILASYQRALEKGFARQAAEAVEESYFFRDAEFPVISSDRISSLVLNAVGTEDAAETAQTRRDAEWVAKVNDFFAETEVLFDNESIEPLELEGFLLLALGLENAKRSSRSAILDVTASKLSSATKTIQIYLRYAYLAERGLGKDARGQLERLADSKMEFPLVSAEQIKSLTKATWDFAKPELSGKEQAIAILDSIQAPELDQVRAAIVLLEEMAKTMTESERGLPEGLIRNLEPLISTIELVEAGKPRDALFKMGQNLQVRYPEVAPAVIRVRKLILMKVISDRFSNLNPQEPQEDDTPVMYLERILDGNLGSDPVNTRYDLLTVLDRAVSITKEEKPTWLRAEIYSHSSFRYAQRLEKVGDTLAALRKYRAVILGSQRFPLDSQVEQAVARIKGTNPELFEPIDDAIHQQMEGIEKSLQILNTKLHRESQSSR